MAMRKYISCPLYAEKCDRTNIIFTHSKFEIVNETRSCSKTTVKLNFISIMYS